MEARVAKKCEEYVSNLKAEIFAEKKVFMIRADCLFHTLSDTFGSVKRGVGRGYSQIVI